MDTDEQQILRLFEDGDRALVSVDSAELSRIFADDYLQYDESGQVFSRQDVIANLTSGQVRYLKMRSTGRRIRLLSPDVAIVHGSEEDEIDQAGHRCVVRYVYMDVVMKRQERWEIVSSQLARS